jgi:hypothetical protein
MVQSARPSIGKYALGERISFGGPGEVYRAQTPTAAGTRREQVAVRLLPATLAADPDFAPRFEREVARLAELDHPGIIPILSYGQQDGVPYIVTPLDPGETLRERFARNRPLPEELLGYLRQIASALDHAHAAGIAHSDLDPAHIVVAEDGMVLVANVGIAALCELEREPGDDDARADVAALARIAQGGLTGSLSATALAGATTPGLAVIRRAIAHEYASAGEFVRDLADAQAGRPAAPSEQRAPVAPARKPATARPSKSPLRLPQALAPQSAAGRRIALLWVAGFVVAVVVIAGALAALGARGDTTPANTAAPVASEAPASKAASSVAPTGDLPLYFPIDNALIGRKYAEAQGLLPAEAADGKLHRFAAECADPRAGADCLLVFVFYSQQANQMYNYHFQVIADTLIGNFVEPAQNADYRVTFAELPWEKNPEWVRLVKESFPQLPANFAPGGFSAGLIGNAAALNDGSSDWALVYVDRDANKQIIFELLGDKVTKTTE